MELAKIWRQGNTTTGGKMKTWQKVLVVVVSGGLVWGLSYCGTIWNTYALVFSSFSAGITALCGILTGFSGSKA